MAVSMIQKCGIPVAIACGIRGWRNWGDVLAPSRRGQGQKNFGHFHANACARKCPISRLCSRTLNNGWSYLHILFHPIFSSIPSTGWKPVLRVPVCFREDIIKKTSAVRSRISSEIIFASCVGYFGRAYYVFYVTTSRMEGRIEGDKIWQLWKSVNV